MQFVKILLLVSCVICLCSFAAIITVWDDRNTCQRQVKVLEEKVSGLVSELEESDQLIKDLFEQETSYEEWWADFKTRSGKWVSVEGDAGEIEIKGRTIGFSNCEKWAELNGQSFLLSDSEDFIFGNYYYFIYIDPDSASELRVLRHWFGVTGKNQSSMYFERELR